MIISMNDYNKRLIGYNTHDETWMLGGGINTHHKQCKIIIIIIHILVLRMKGSSRSKCAGQNGQCNDWKQTS